MTFSSSVSHQRVSKCEFNKPELQFLGHIVGQGGIKMDANKTATVAKWPVPQDVHQMIKTQKSIDRLYWWKGIRDDVVKLGIVLR